MNDVRIPEEPEEADDLYRQAAAADTSRPSETVRVAVLEHAARAAVGAAARSGQSRPAKVDVERWLARRSMRRPALIGTLAAAALAGLLIAPRFLIPQGGEPAATPARQEAYAPQEATALQRAPVPEETPVAKETPPSHTAVTSVAKSTPATRAQNASAGRARAKSLDETALAEQPAPAPASPAVQPASPPLFARAATSALSAPAMMRPKPADLAAALRRDAESGSDAELRYLLDAGVEVDARDAGGRTALMLAAAHGNAQAVGLLLAHGADPNAADAGGLTPLQLAMDGHRPEIAETLRRAGAR
jgi:Meckel syndrome type 1 protein